MRSCVWIFCLLILAAGPVTGAAAGERSDGAFSAGDTLRTNIWIAESLLRDMVNEAVEYLPDPPANIELVVPRGHDARDLLLTVATRRLLDDGYTVYEREFPIAGQTAPPDDEEEEAQSEGEAPAPTPPAWFDGELYLSLEQLEMSHPAVGRRLGIWKQWIDRELRIAMFAKVGLPATGQLIFRDRMERVFSDRVPADDLAGTESAAYTFASGEISEIGWRGRMEQIVVLGTLAGLVAVYFANAE